MLHSWLDRHPGFPAHLGLAAWTLLFVAIAWMGWASSQRAQTETALSNPSTLIGIHLLVWLVGLVGIHGAGALARNRRVEREQRFREIQESEERYRSVVESSPEGFWLVDAEGRILEVNDQYLRRSGYGRAELLLMQIRDLEGEETPEMTATRMRRIQSDGASVFETVHRAKDGTFWPVEATVTYTPGQGGRYAAFFRDLSRQRQAEALLRVRGELADLAQSAGMDSLLQTALDRAESLTSSTIGFYHFVESDEEHLSLQTWSTNTRRHMCTAAAEERHYPVQAAGVWVDCLRTGRAVIHNDYANLAHKRGLPPGHAPVSRLITVPVRRGERCVAIMGVGNKPTCYSDADAEIVDAVASLVTDFALRRRAQQELEHFFELVPGLVCIANARGDIRRLNREWQTLLGRQASEMTAHEFLGLVHPADRRRTRREFLRAVRGHRSHRFVNRCRAADGSYHWIEWDAAALDQERLLFVAAQDITERRRAEDLMRLQAELGLALSATTEPMALLQLSLRTAIEAAEMECGGLYLKDAATGELEMVAHHGLSAEFVARVRCYPAESGRADFVARGGVYVGRYADLPKVPGEPEHDDGLRAIAVVPLHHQGEVIGCVNIASRSFDVMPEWAQRHIGTMVTQIGSVVARVHAGQALRESEERFRRLFEGAQDAIFWADADTGIITHCNRAAETLLDRPRSEILGQHQTLLHPAEDLNRVKALFQTHASSSNRATAEVEVVRRDGSLRSVLISPSVIRFEGVSIVQGIFHDLTEHKQAERDLRRHQALLQAIYENAPFVICLLDEQGRVETLNRPLQAPEWDRERPSLEFTLGAALGCRHASAPAGVCGSGDSCGTCRLHLAVSETLRSGRAPKHLEFQVPQRRPGGDQILDVAASLAFVPVEGRSRLLLCLEDVTHLRLLERQFLQAQKLEAIGQLAGGVAHDFNNILAVMMMHLHLLKEQPELPAEVRASVRDLELETDRASALTRQLLLFARRQVAQVRRLDLNEIVEGLLKMLRRLLGEHIQVAFEPSPLPAWIDADAGMLEQVILNLCVNARDAMPKGGPLRLSIVPTEVSPEMARRSADARVGSFVRLSVADQGEGIEPELVSRIFEPFFTTKPAGKGTGLGLAMVYGIARQHQGWVEVHSVPRAGAVFDVFLPTADPGPSLHASEPLLALPRGHERILLVEDDSSLRRSVSRLLNTLGYQVHQSGTGLEALEFLQRNPDAVDLVFSDVVMPDGISGLDLAERLRSIRPGIKVLLASGYSPELAGSGGLLSGALELLAKPYQPADLARAVRRCLES
ncbi:MAG: PAS domain S-box protein [Verrucomicrobiales bacterium]|nr:PAS domain S-box protein [Verrucomicrobiales bacterium]